MEDSRLMKWANNGSEIPKDMKMYFRCRKKPIEVKAFKAPEPILIETLEGIMRADKGDFIICGVNGEHYPCKPDIFWKTYEQIGLLETDK